MSKYAIVKKRIAFKNRWRQIDEWILRFVSGNREKFYFCIEPAVVVVFAVTEQNMVIVIKQHSIFVGRSVRQLPAGFIDKKEKPLAAAKRELLEETGYTAKKWVKLGAGFKGKYVTGKVHYYLAAGASLSKDQNLEESEFIKMEFLSPATLEKHLLLGKIEDISCANGAWWGIKYLQRKK